MPRPIVVSTFPLGAESLARLAPVCDVVANTSSEPWPRERYLRELAVADALIAFMPDSIDEGLLTHAPRLAFVSCALKGTDNFDLHALAARGIEVARVEDLLTEPTAELAIGLAVSAARHVIVADAHVRAGAFAGWRPTFYGRGIAGSDVGILGFGAIGRAIAERLVGWRASIRSWDVERARGDDRPAGTAEFAGFDEVVATSDFLFLALPLTERTRHLIGAKALAAMKPDAVLVNVARGSLVDEVAVADALEAGRLGGYAADVFAFEDWALPGRPAAIEPRLLTRRGATVFTPHLGSAVASVRSAIEARAVDNTIAFFRRRDDGGAVRSTANEA